MKAMTNAFAVAVVCLAAPLALAGHHVDGTWKLGVTFPGQQPGTATFDLQEGEGGKLTGTYTGAAGSADVTGTVDGSDVQFTFDSQAGKVTYQGTVTGDTMSGTCTYGMLGECTFEGSKQGS